MESFNDFIKDKFNADLPDAPENLQWNAMKSDILSKLEEEKPPLSRTRLYLKGGVVIIALLMFGLVVCNYVTSEKEQNPEIALDPSNSNQLKTEKNQNTRVNKNIAAQALEIEISEITPLQMNEAVVQEDINTIPATANSIELGFMPSKDTNTRLNAAEQNSVSLALVNNQGPTQDGLKPNTESANAFLVEMDIIEEDAYDLINTRDALEMVESVNVLETVALDIVKNRIGAFNSLKEEEQKFNAGRLMLSSAYVFWNPNHGNSAIDQRRNDLETPIASFQTSISYQIEISKNWAWSAGLEYQSLASRFNYENVSDIKVLQEDIVKEIEINYVTKDSSYIYGDSLVNGRATRKVIHYNSNKLINVPIYVYKSWNRGPWALEWSGGTVINIYSDSKGRTISANEEIQDYSKSSAPLYKSWKGFALSSGLSCSYRINPSASIGARLEGRTYVSNWNLEAGNSTRPYMMSVGIFGRYNF